MRAWIIAGAGAFLVLFAAGVLITTLPKRRAAAESEMCKRNLKDLAAFAAMNADPDPAKALKAPHEVPAGTIVLPGMPPEERLSWIVGALPALDQRHQSTTDIIAAIDQTKPWESPANQNAAKTRIGVLLCPGNPSDAVIGSARPTQYVGIGGLGDAARFNTPTPESGSFRYDSPTPFADFQDGLGQTLLFGERSEELGPWLRGGSSTLRGLAKNSPMAGFLGNHPDASNWAMADGSVRVFTPRIDPKILLSLATIAGKDTDEPPE